VQKGRHIINPRAATPVSGGRAAWVVAESATRADAISTACMVMTGEEIARFYAAHPEVQILVVESAGEEGETVTRYGFPSDPSARLTARIS
jgi:thiamine biosynthesis lipoprotein ApbE